MADLHPGRAIILRGDAKQIPLPDGCVQTVITSPPYWGLRAYTGQGERGLGLEATVKEYVANLVVVFEEVWRVLRDDGTVWLNLGDCYATGAGAVGHHPGGGAQGAKWRGDGLPAVNGRGEETGRKDVQIGPMTQPNRMPQTGLKTKDLVGMPWRVAFALQAAGWYLRSDIIWAKGVSFCPTYAGSVMPESVTDRPTRGHEYLFLLTKQPRYYWNPVAAKEPGTYAAGTRGGKGSGTREGNRRNPKRPRPDSERFHERWAAAEDDGYATYSGYRNLRDVWAIGTRPYKEAHFATFPEGLVEPCLQIGSAPWACAACSAPYIQVLDQEPVPPEIQAQFEAARTATVADTGRTDGHTQRKPNYVRKVTGDHWEPTCACDCPDTEFQIVLDPFGGSGTVAAVAQRLGRWGVSLDLSADYGQLARRRCRLAEAIPAAAPDDDSDLELEAAVGD